MRDAIGNTINKGDLIALSLDLDTFRRLTYTVVEVEDKGQPYLAFTFVLAINLPPDHAGEIFVEHGRVLRNPKDEEMVNRLMQAGGRPQ